MAKLKSPLILKWRSTVGGVTGQIARPGKIARRHFTTHIHDWPNRGRYNSIMSAMISDWRSLSSTERDEWDSFGLTYPQPDRYGNMIELSGWCWFLKLNSITRLFVGQSIPNPPPSDEPDFLPILGIIDVGEGNPVYLENSILPVPPGCCIHVKRRLNMPVSRSSPGILNWYTSLPSGTGFLSPIAWPGEMLAGDHSHFFSAMAIDAYGRKGTFIHSRIVRSP